MYALIQGRYASMYELKEVYNLDEALMLYDLISMQKDIERMKMESDAAEGGG